ncbi:hypothetical protein SGLAM104S_00953 [Streptomyces glaucescens]
MAGLLGARRGVRKRARRDSARLPGGPGTARRAARRGTRAHRGPHRPGRVPRWPHGPRGRHAERHHARHGTTSERLYAAGKTVVGDDPDVIVPGQHLEP